MNTVRARAIKKLITTIATLEPRDSSFTLSCMSSSIHMGSGGHLGCDAFVYVIAEIKSALYTAIGSSVILVAYMGVPLRIKPIASVDVTPVHGEDMAMVINRSALLDLFDQF